jgi:hypothetical protein
MIEKSRPSPNDVRSPAVAFLTPILVLLGVLLACAVGYYAFIEFQISVQVSRVQQALDEQCPNHNLTVQRQSFSYDPIFSWSHPDAYCYKSAWEDEYTCRCAEEQE